ncbi:uncharacterized protein LOC124426157 [Vespa crabro]|uniref:uncharacterized protein LOC124426157 n=1 Tax=Vespa crabro TaxID=7445 RepID=UPI001F02CCBC|nr:uncharacterized protein LOC124426157 [Vespa crabro]
MQWDLIVAGEFNAKALEWGEAKPDFRGRRIMDVVSRLALVVLNTSSTLTFRRTGYRETIPYVSLANEHLVTRVAGWRMIEEYTGSDHQYILFEVHDRSRESIVNCTSQDDYCSNYAAHSNGLRDSGAKKSTKRQRRPVYWWMNEIADLHKKCLRLRRLPQRAKRRNLDTAPLAAEYQAAKKFLKRTIKTSQKRVISTAAPGITEAPQFTEEDLLRAASSMRNKKALGPDGLQRNKGKGSAEAASLYRPISMLDTAGMLLEELLRLQMHAALSAMWDLAARQYGFRSGLSTIHAVQEVVTAAKMAERWNQLTQHLCLLANLDVRNAFNSVKSLELTSGVAQGFILGPDIWNIFYNGILGMAVPEVAFLVGYADNIAIVITARDTFTVADLVGCQVSRSNARLQTQLRRAYNKGSRQGGRSSNHAGHTYGQCQRCRRSYDAVRHVSMGRGAAKREISQAHSRGTEEGRFPNRLLLPHGLRARSASCSRGNPDRTTSQFVDQQTPVLGKEEASKNARSNSIEAWQSRWELEPRGR